MDVKQCSKCKEAKALSEFNTRPDRKSGYRSECKKCQYAAQRLRERAQQHKVRAKGIAFLAARKGILHNPFLCEHCSQIQPLDKHHPDYKKPVKVQWLCRQCHTQEHARLGSYAKS